MENRKKAAVLGGSNGIGLAVTLELLDRGYEVEILDRAEPDTALENRAGWQYTPFDMVRYDGETLERLAGEENLEAVVLTAGFGRVADFQFLHPAEVRQLMEVNACATIWAVRCFYDRIRSEKAFYCGVMGSIAGWVSSPMFSVYAASKAAVCRFAESVNIELEQAGVENRILNVSPGSFQGSRFNGGENRPELLAVLAGEIIDHMLARDTLFIPGYEETYKDVLRRYHADPHGFGMESCRYKLASGRVRNEKKAVVGYLSGTFDLFHIGHLNLIRRARACCDYLIVGVHPTAAHKGKNTFIPFAERREIVGTCKYVDRVVDACSEDCDAWPLWHFDRLFVGSDYKGTPRFQRYEEYFADKNVEIVYFPYTQSTSSTQLRELIDTRLTEKKPK